MKKPNAWAERALKLARNGHEPTPRDRARVRALLVARCLAEPGLASALTSEAAFATKATALGTSKALAWKVVIALGIGSAAGITTTTLLVALQEAPRAASAPPPEARFVAGAKTRPRSTSTRTPASEPSTNSSAAPVSTRGTRAERQGAGIQPDDASRVRVPSPPANGSASFQAAKDLTLELAGLRRAQELLHGGEPEAALRELSALDERSATSVLVEEREATRALATCTARGGDERALDGFARRYPNSLHLERVRGVCGTPSTKSTRPDTDRGSSRH